MLLNDAFDLKSSQTLLHTIIRMKDLDPELFQRMFRDTAAKAPKLFQKSSMVLDLQKTPGTLSQDALNEIKVAIESTGAKLLAISHPTSQQESVAHTLDIPILKDCKDSTPTIRVQHAREVMLTNKVRRSMQIYAKNKDLIVRGDVNQGAEVIADGSIYVFGSLHGKAIAGASGDLCAQIITLSFNPELLAIAGVYVLHENIPSQHLEQRMRTYYHDSKIQFNSLGETNKISGL